MLLSDVEIKRAVMFDRMIEPFERQHIRKVEVSVAGLTVHARAVLSYGLSSYGYDLRLAPDHFLVFRHVPGTVVDVKDFNSNNLYEIPLNNDPIYGDYFILPAHSYGLGVSLEKFQMPENITGVCIGKSTYARAGIICNCTPAEAGWEGHLTLEFSNSSSADCRLYANEGICQMLFMKGNACKTTYMKRKGKYQGQPRAVVPPRI